MTSDQGRIQGGAIGRSAPLKPTKVTFFTMIFYNSENSIGDIRPVCRPLFRHSSVLILQFGKQHWRYNTSLPSIVSSQQCFEVYAICLTIVNPWWNDSQILLKSPPLKLLAGSDPASDMVFSGNFWCFVDKFDVDWVVAFVFHSSSHFRTKIS